MIRYGDQRIDRRKLALFCRQFGSMLSAGIDYLPIISVLREQADSQEMREILDSLERDLKLGRLLSTSMCRFPKTFSPYFINMVRQGEREDMLDQVFIKLADHLDYEAFHLDSSPTLVPRGDGAARPSARGDWQDFVAWHVVGLASAGVAAGVVWHLTNFGLLPATSLGPNICLVTGGGVLLSSWLYARRRAGGGCCAWCGADEAEELTIRNGIALCRACLAEQARISDAADATQQSSPDLVNGGGAALDPAIAEETEEEILGYDVDMESLYEDEA